MRAEMALPIVGTVAEIGRSVGYLAIASAHASIMQAPMPAYFVQKEIRSQQSLGNSRSDLLRPRRTTATC